MAAPNCCSGVVIGAGGPEIEGGVCARRALTSRTSAATTRTRGRLYIGRVPWRQIITASECATAVDLWQRIYFVTLEWRPNRRMSQVPANAAAATPDKAPQRIPLERGGGGSATTPRSSVTAGA